MASLEPRDFHIGSLLRYRFADGSYGDRCRVEFAHKEADGRGIRVRFDDGTVDVLGAKNLTHASDGAPLGEWVPIKVDSEHTSGFGSISEDGTSNGEYFDISVHTVNAIIRGEVRQ